MLYFPNEAKCVIKVHFPLSAEAMNACPGASKSLKKLHSQKPEQSLQLQSLVHTWDIDTVVIAQAEVVFHRQESLFLSLSTPKVG
jgi:hypothetical protein